MIAREAVGVDRTPLKIFLLMVTAVLAVSSILVRTTAFASEPELFSVAITLDLAVLLPGAYLIVAGRMGWPRLSVIPVLLLALLLSRLVLPAQHAPRLEHLELIALPLELIVVSALVLKVRRVMARYRVTRAGTADLVEAVENAVADVVGHRRLARALATEVSMLYYGLLGWGRPRSTDAQATAVSYHRECGYGAIVAVLLFVVLVEVVAVHNFVASWSVVAAWVLSLLSLYGGLFLLADLNAARHRPILILDNTLLVTIGLRWRVSVPISAIQRLERVTTEIEDRDALLDAVLIGGQNVVLHLDRELVALGPYGIERTFNRLALAVDDVDRLGRALGPQLEAGGGEETDGGGSPG
jgi:hypothetical protein